MSTNQLSPPRPRSYRTRHDWDLVDVAVLRMAGFPFHWLAELSDGSAARAAAEVLHLEDQLRHIRQWAYGYHAPLPSAGDRALLQRLRAGRPVRPTDGPGEDTTLREQVESATRLHTRLQAARENFTEAYESDISSGSLATVERFRRQPTLRDALLVSNDTAAEHLTRWLRRIGDDPTAWRSADRKSLTTLVRYLQRLCAKNETTSHFGPFAIGTWTEDADGISWSTGPITRTSRLSRWAADAVAQTLVTPGPAERRPHRAAGAFLNGPVLHVVAVTDTLTRSLRDAIVPHDPVVLDPFDARLLAACDGGSTVVDLASALLGDTGPEAVACVADRLDALAALGALRPEPELPFGTVDVVDSLRRLLAVTGTPDYQERLAHLDQLQRILTDLAGADVDQRPHRVRELKTFFTSVTGRPARRDTDRQFYADHALFSEDCLAPVRDIRLGRQLRRMVTDELAPLHDLLLLPARLRFEHERRMLATWYREQFDDRPVPLGTYLTRFMAELDDLDLRYDEMRAAVQRQLHLVDATMLPAAEEPSDGPPAHRHEVPLDAVLAVLASSELSAPAMCSPDVMVIAGSTDAVARGEFQVVVGDAHATEENLSHGMFSPHLHHHRPAYAERIVRGYQGLAEADEVVVDVTQTHRNATFVRSELPCPDLEALDRSPGRDREVLRFHDLVVVPGDRGLRLQHQPTGRYLRMMAPPLAWCRLPVNPMDIFAFPSRVTALAAAPGRGHIPRLVTGRVVLQRETWRLPIEDLRGTDLNTGFLTTQRTRRRLELPQHVYVKIPGQPKPVYCDLDSPILVRSLVGLLPPTGEIEVSEMLPGPDDLWLTTPEGRHTSEVRYTVFSGRSRLSGWSRPMEQASTGSREGITRR
ncbi:lantibiotic dehydratase [Micromonospora sp. NPDC000316]|uniref:lantibiotic dehydratase n=1 Tax=Micromonospora sp. NPDC000316 TaxID=3364216 RepID=UPI0036781C36